MLLLLLQSVNLKWRHVNTHAWGSTACAMIREIDCHVTKMPGHVQGPLPPLVSNFHSAQFMDEEPDLSPAVPYY